MRYLTLNEALELHRRVIGQSGGALGVLNLGALASALAQPRMTFAGKDVIAEPVTEWWVRVLISGKPKGWLLIDETTVQFLDRQF